MGWGGGGPVDLDCGQKEISNFFIPQHEMTRKANTDGETSVKLNFLSEKTETDFFCVKTVRFLWAKMRVFQGLLIQDDRLPCQQHPLPHVISFLPSGAQTRHPPGAPGASSWHPRYLPGPLHTWPKAHTCPVYPGQMAHSPLYS